MAELPFHLKTIEPLNGALDIIRYLSQIDEPTADADEICDYLDLSDRSFSKAIRRLVTKGYVQMDGHQSYRLTEQGDRGALELAQYDAETGGGLGKPRVSDDVISTETAQRRMVLAVPDAMTLAQKNEVLLGFHAADDAGQMQSSAEIVARVSVVNGQPDAAEDLIFSLNNGAMQQSLEVTPEAFTHVRIRVEVFQLGDNPGDIYGAGGMYVDVPVSEVKSQSLKAYGTDIEITL